MSDKLKWGFAFESTHGNFLLGANLNIGRYSAGWGGYVIIYLGFRLLVIGKDIF